MIFRALKHKTLTDTFGKIVSFTGPGYYEIYHSETPYLMKESVTIKMTEDSFSEEKLYYNNYTIMI